MSGNLNRQLSEQEFDAKLSLADFVVGDSDDPLVPPLAFTQWRQAGAWEAALYEPQMLASADARTTINYEGRSRSVINLCSYNYLGLANRPEVISASRDALAKYGLGACGSPLLSGMTVLHRQLERSVAQLLGREDAMLFNSGFGGALGTLSGLLRKTDVAILDNRSHLSLRDGAVLSRCRVDRFEHNDPASLEAALSRRKGRRQLVIAEGIYSMDGDFAKLDELLDIAKAHKASVFIDEAHSILACGKNGRGAAEEFGVENRIPLVYGTFSKAFAAVGGFVAGSVDTLDYLRFYAHSYAYSCALPPVVGDRALMYELGHKLRRGGLFVAPVDYPAVPEDRICFRACVTANHTRADLDEALNILADTLVPAVQQNARAS